MSLFRVAALTFLEYFLLYWCLPSYYDRSNLGGWMLLDNGHQGAPSPLKFVLVGTILGLYAVGVGLGSLARLLLTSVAAFFFFLALTFTEIASLRMLVGDGPFFLPLLLQLNWSGSNPAAVTLSLLAQTGVIYAIACRRSPAGVQVSE